ncbi:MAG: acyl-CoA dehydrogenase, partial [Actinomycetia bacterium]|nr:acyl-CoA dehydrogenase [Actinomycetes bacterium]
MSHYKSNLRDIEFNLFEVLGVDKVLGTGPYEDLDLDTARSILHEIDRTAREDLAPSFAESDRTPPVYDPQTCSVTMPDAFKKSYRAWMDAEWFRLQIPAELGGQPAPNSLVWASSEFVLGSNPPIWMYACGPAFASIVYDNGTEHDQRIAQHMVD